MTLPFLPLNSRMFPSCRSTRSLIPSTLHISPQSHISLSLRLFQHRVLSVFTKRLYIVITCIFSILSLSLSGPVIESIVATEEMLHSRCERPREKKVFESPLCDPIDNATTAATPTEPSDTRLIAKAFMDLPKPTYASCDVDRDS